MPILCRYYNGSRTTTFKSHPAFTIPVAAVHTERCCPPDYGYTATGSHHSGSEGPPLATGSAPCRLQLALLVYKSLYGFAPPYLADDCILASSDKFRRRLRSADVDTFIVPRTRIRFGDRICGGQTITEDISVCLGTAETAAH